MTIPTSLLYDYERIPRDRQVALLMRHSARFPIIDPADTYIITLTEEGVRMAEELGEILGRTHLGGRLLASPVNRCLATAEAIARGAGWPGTVEVDERLSHPHIEPAWDQYNRGEVNGVLPGPVRAALDLVLDYPDNQPVLDILVTHDTVVGTLAGCLLKAPVQREYWPGFLEGLFVWKFENGVHVRWRGEERVLRFD
jgi:broad specificity phosphatase PhoE